MKLLKICLLIYSSVACSLFADAQDSVHITKVPKFKPPVVKTFLGINQDGALVTAEEARQLIALPLKITDDKNNSYPIESYQFLYKKKGFLQDEETGKVSVVFTIQASHFDKTPLPKIWVDNLQDGFQKDEQLYFFDIIVKDKEGRGFFAPPLKITIR